MELRSWLVFFLYAVELCRAQRADGQYWPCNPIVNSSCPPNPALPQSSYSLDFTAQSALPSGWSMSSGGTPVTFDTSGAEFTFAKRYDAPQIYTDFYILFGRVEVVMQAAPGQGIISSSVLLSDDFDEIDWEWSGNNFGLVSSGGQVQTNYFGKGITGNYDRGAFVNVTNPQTTFHTYAVDWTPTSLVWSIDGTPVRTLLAADCTTQDHQYPQTPSKIQLGLWDGGDAGENPGTVAWAGGFTNVSLAPFTMRVKSISITNQNPAYAYNWTNHNGTSQSIQLIQNPNWNGSSTSSSGAPTSSPSANPPTSTLSPTSSISTTPLGSTIVSSPSGAMSMASGSATSRGTSPVTTSLASGVVNIPSTSSGSSSPTSLPSSSAAFSTNPDLLLSSSAALTQTWSPLSVLSSSSNSPSEAPQLPGMPDSSSDNLTAPIIPPLMLPSSSKTLLLASSSTTLPPSTVTSSSTPSSTSSTSSSTPSSTSSASLSSGPSFPLPEGASSCPLSPTISQAATQTSSGTASSPSLCPNSHGQIRYRGSGSYLIRCGMDIPYSDIAMYPGGNLESCISMCDQQVATAAPSGQPSCNGVAYRPDQGQCYLKYFPQGAPKPYSPPYAADCAIRLPGGFSKHFRRFHGFFH